MRSDADLESLWRFCTRHRDLLEQSDRAGCFHCEALFSPTEIVEWIDEPPSTRSGTVVANGTTALCPRCGVDAVRPGAKVPLSAELLTQMAERYFGGRFTPSRSTRPAG
jgi:hypothetical protein